MSKDTIIEKLLKKKEKLEYQLAETEEILDALEHQKKLDDYK
jgi:hypothetical protein